MRKTPVLTLVLALVSIAAASAGVGSDACRRTLVFWAWERAEDLRFLDSRCTAVAWFAGHAEIESGSLRFTPRRQRLELKPGQAHWPVVRIDGFGAPPAGDDDSRRRQDFLRNLRRFVSSTHLANGLQIDFDAPQSWRPFYTKLLRDIRSTLAPSAPLTITALASWCLGDPWIRDAGVTEAVPMLFRMGPDGPDIRRALASASFSVRACRGNVGISLDEPAPEGIVRSARRVYVFAPRAWTADLATRAYATAAIAHEARSEQE